MNFKYGQIHIYLYNVGRVTPLPYDFLFYVLDVLCTLVENQTKNYFNIEKKQNI